MATISTLTSQSEIDISANLDEMEIENLVSFLATDDNVFDDLNKLHLPNPPMLDLGFVSSQPGDLSIEDIDELLTFHDALEYQPDMQTQDCYSTLDQQNWIANHPSMEVISPLINPQIMPHNDAGLSLFNDLTMPIFLEPLQSLPTSKPNITASLQAGVAHDHTYAAKDIPSVHKLESTMLTRVCSDSFSCDLSGRGSDDNEEGNSSDGGYETMSSTSPASTNSGHSGQSKGVPSVCNSTSSPLSLVQLHPDPVKLIDERIKFFMSRQQVQLTEEEKETLKAEGLPIPTTLPLTKTEEKALKSVRRKIRNKLAAQESRKKKKEYMESLEDRLSHCTQDNLRLMKKVETLEVENHTLLQQLTQLQALVARTTNPMLGRPIHPGTCLMVVVLCFGILFGNLLPYKVSFTSDVSYTAASVRSRALLSVDSPPESWMNWKEYYKYWLPGNQHELTSPKQDHLDYYKKHNVLKFGIDLVNDNNTDFDDQRHPSLLASKA